MALVYADYLPTYLWSMLSLYLYSIGTLEYALPEFYIFFSRTFLFVLITEFFSCAGLSFLFDYRTLPPVCILDFISTLGVCPP